VHLLRLLPPGGPSEGPGRVRERANGNAVPRAPDVVSVRHGLHARLRGVPRTDHDRQGVHAGGFHDQADAERIV
jgi:hypothetical protein